MNIFFRKYWLYILAAAITIFGLITGWYLFIFLVFPLSLLRSKKKDESED